MFAAVTAAVVAEIHKRQAEDAAIEAMPPELREAASERLSARRALESQRAHERELARLVPKAESPWPYAVLGVIFGVSL